jgi:hypothetical protein
MVFPYQGKFEYSGDISKCPNMWIFGKDENSKRGILGTFTEIATKETIYECCFQLPEKALNDLAIDDTLSVKFYNSAKHAPKFNVSVKITGEGIDAKTVFSMTDCLRDLAVTIRGGLQLMDYASCMFELKPKKRLFL